MLVDTPTGAQVPLAQLATLRFVNGPPMIRDENGMLAGYVFLDMTGRDVGGYVEDLKRVVAAKLSCRQATRLPGPVNMSSWSGQSTAEVRRAVDAHHHLRDLLFYVPLRRANLHGDGWGAALISQGRLVPVDPPDTT